MPSTTSTSTAAAASSKTLRINTKLLSERLKVPSRQTKYPREDFNDTLDLAAERTDARAIEWYQRGILRGLTFAMNQVKDGKFELKKGKFVAPEEFELKVRIRLQGKSAEPHLIKVAYRRRKWIFVSLEKVTKPRRRKIS